MIWDGQNHKYVTRKEMLFLSTLSLTQRINHWFSMAELLIHLQGNVAQTYTLILIHHFSSLETCQSAAWENSRHLAMLPLVSPPNDVWETSAEIPYWWRITTQIWVVTRHQYGISVPVCQTSFHRKTSDGVAKCWLFSQASQSATGQFFFSVPIVTQPSLLLVSKVANGTCNILLLCVQ